MTIPFPFRPCQREPRRGQALLDFALAMPFFFVLLLLILEGGRLMGTHISVSNAARAGARIAALPTKTNADVRTTVNNLTLKISGPGFVNSGTTNATSDIDIECSAYSGVNQSGTWGSYSECTSDGSSGTVRRTQNMRVRVTVTWTYDPVPLFSGPMGLVNPSWSQLSLTAVGVAFVE